MLPQQFGGNCHDDKSKLHKLPLDDLRHLELAGKLVSLELVKQSIGLFEDLG